MMIITALLQPAVTIHHCHLLGLSQRIAEFSLKHVYMLHFYTIQCLLGYSVHK
jgi:hypothetical protein